MRRIKSEQCARSNRNTARDDPGIRTNLLTLRTIQDSLAGRIELLPLMPLSQDELAANGPALNYLSPEEYEENLSRSRHGVPMP
jgi:hypothetical protein